MEYIIHIKTDNLNTATNVIEEIARSFAIGEVQITSTTS